MNIRRFIALFLCFVVCFPVLTLQCTAFERDDHDKYMEQVLFKNYKEIKGKENGNEEETALHAIECASYLAIDQYNGKGEKDLKFLKDFKVNDLPLSLSDIDYTASGKTHRNSTHRGWDFKYIGEAADRWVERKSILLNTADSIFDFKNAPAKKDAFCALIYYVHVLGDHMDDESYKTQNGFKIDIGGRTDHYDIISELEKHIKILFKDQNTTQKYSSLIAGLDKYNSKLKKLVQSEGGINTEEKFEAKQEYTKNVMALLTMYIPEMLKSEEFFAEVFYK